MKTLIIVLAVSLSGCLNTFDRSMQGVGEDMQSLGQSITNTFQPGPDLTSDQIAAKAEAFFSQSPE